MSLKTSRNCLVLSCANRYQLLIIRKYNQFNTHNMTQQYNQEKHILQKCNMRKAGSLTGMYRTNVPSLLPFLCLSYNCGSSVSHTGAVTSSK